jgi:hypothetical protein
MKSLTTLILSMFLCSSAYAEDVGQFTFLGSGQCAPFEGTLFDAKATSRLLTLEEEMILGCNAQLDFELAKQRTELQLDLDSQRIRFEADIKEKDLAIETQLRQISDLQNALKKVSANNKWLYAAGGVATGIALSYAAYEVLVK